MASFAEYTKKKKKQSAAGVSFTDYTKSVLGKDDIETPVYQNKSEDIAPVKTESKPWYKSGHFEDGYDFGDVTKTILGVGKKEKTVTDAPTISSRQDYNTALQQLEAAKTVDLNSVKLEVSDLEAKTTRLTELTERVSQLRNSISASKSYSGRSGFRYTADKEREDNAKLSAAEAELNSYLSEIGYKDLDELTAAYTEKKAYYKSAKYIQKGAKLAAVSSNGDFDKLTGKGLAADIEFGEKTRKKNYGKAKGTRSSVDKYYAAKMALDESYGIKTADTGNHESLVSLYRNMTNEELKIFEYHLIKDDENGTKNAYDYIDSLEQELETREAQQKYAKTADSSNLYKVGYGMEAGLDQFASGVKSLLNTDDEYIPVNSTQLLGQMYRSDLAEEGAKLPEALGGASTWQMAYDVVNTSSNMLPSILTSVAVGTVSKTAGAALGATLLGSSAAGNSYQAMLNEGYDKEQARTYSTLVGISEAGLSYALGGIGALGGKVTGIGINHAVSGISNAFLRFSAEFGMHAAAEGFEEGAQEVLNPIFENIALGYKKNNLEDTDWEQVAYSALLGAATGGLMEGGPIAVDAVTNKTANLTATEQAVVEKEAEKRIAEEETDGKTLTKKEKNKIYDEVIADLDKGGISIDTIEEALGGETYTTYKDTFDSETEQEAALQAEIEALENTPKEQFTVKQSERLDEARRQLEELKSNSKRSELKTQLGVEVFGLAKDSRLAESYYEKGRRSESFDADLTEYDTKIQPTIQKAIDSGILNNTRRTHEFVEMIARISADKGVPFDFTNNERLAESGFAVQGRTINGLVTKDGVSLNIDSAKALEKTVGHEITHVLEGTELYTELQSALFEYAKIKNDYQGRYDTLTELYKSVEGADIDAELTADLVGDYLFTDSDFVNRLSTENRNVFQKIYDEIKYLCKIVTAGSKEARQLEKVKRAFDKAYKANGKGLSDTQYSLSAEQEAYFKDSKVRDKKGKLQPVYHGTKTGGFTIFEKSDDIGYFFSKTKRTASTYANGVKSEFKPSAKSESVSPDKYSPMVYKSYLNMKNPMIFEGNGAQWNQLTAENTLENVGFTITAKNWRGSSGDMTITFTRDNKTVKKKIKTGEEFDRFVTGYFGGVDATIRLERLINDFIDENGNLNIGEGLSLPWDFSKRELVNTSKLKTTRDIVREAKAAGHDGVIFKDIVDIGSHDGKYKADDVYVVFDSNQVKSVSNKTPTSHPDIRYSLSEDSQGRQLTEEQQDFFQNSAVRDENGNLKVMYHGTSGGGFTVFDTYGSQYGLFGTGSYFTDNKEIAESYTKKGKGKSPKVYQSYLNITNPLDMDTEAKPQEWQSAFEDVDFPESGTNEDFYRAVEEYYTDQMMPKWEVAEIIQSSVQSGMGYDGITHIGGGRVNQDGAKHRVYIAFEPEQIKNVDNSSPTSNADIRYSLSDSEGTSLSKEQQEFFKDSKMRDEDGSLKVMYHGSEYAGFHEFNSRFSDDDTSFFFVDRNDVAQSYSGSSEVYTAKSIRTIEDFNNFLVEIDETDDYKATEENGKYILWQDGDKVGESDTAAGLYDEFCDWTGLGQGQANYKVYLNLKNPLEIDAEGRNWNRISGEFSQEVYDRIKSLTDEEKTALKQIAAWEDMSIFRDEIQTAVESVERGATYVDNHIRALASAAEKLGDTDMYRLFDIATDNFAEESLKENAVKYLNTREYAQRAKEQGYDGVIFKNIVDNGGYSDGREGASTVAIAFNSNQIKSVANDKPTSSADIRYSLSMDSQGRELSKGQQDFFKDSKIVDENGSLKVMHHGSHEAFTVFDKKKAKSSGTYGNGFYFTDSDSHAKTYGETYDVYLNITNPLQNGTNDITREQLRKFVEAIAENEDYGIENYGYGATVDSVTDSVFGKTDFAMIMDLNISCVGNMVEAVELFNKVNGTDYNGIVAPLETVAFYPEQIKSVENKAPTSNADIRYSLSQADDTYLSAVESGDTATAQRMVDEAARKSMPNSLVRDESGNLLTVYHGSPSKFTVFQHSKMNTHGNAHGRGFYFTENRSLAEGYEKDGGQLLKGYLNIERPLSEEEVTIKKSDLLKLIKATCEGEAQNLVEDGGYDSVREALLDTWISNYVNTYEIDINDAYKKVADIIYSGNDNDVEIIAEITNGGAGVENTLKLTHDILGYDGVIYTNTDGNHEFVSLVSNQFKSAEPITYDDNGNVIPLSQRFNAENEDIRNSLSQEGEHPTKRPNLTYGEDIRLDRKDVAPVKKAAETTENAIPEGYAPITEEEAANMARENLDTLDDADAPPIEETEYYELPDTTRLDERTLKGIAQSLKDTLYLDKHETKAIQDVVQKYSTTEFPSREELFDEIKRTFGEKVWTERNEEVAQVRDTLRHYRLKVSDKIKSDIPDYRQFMRSHFGKIRFSNDGVDVDTAYAELSEMYPDFFPEDIINPTDQFYAIADAADMDINTEQSYDLDDATIQEAVDVITAEVAKYKESATMAEAEQSASEYLDEFAPFKEPQGAEQYEAIRPQPKKQPKLKRVDTVETEAAGEKVYGDRVVRADSTKQRRWVETSTESEPVDGKITPEDLDQDLITYQPIPNAKTLGQANARLDSMGYDSALAYFNSQFANRRIELSDIALGERLIQEAVKKGDTKTAGELIQNVAILGTELGQKVQALSIIQRLTPEGQLKMLRKIVDRGKSKGDKAFEGVELTQEMVDKILGVYNAQNPEGGRSYEQAKLDAVIEEVKQEIADQMKVTGLEKANAWRYLSMLGNPKTHIRNLVSNIAMRGTVAVKNVLARTIEDIAPIKNRTKTWHRASAEVSEYAKKVTLEMKDVISGDTKYSDNTSIKSKRKIFKSKILNALYGFNTEWLSKEDWWFSKPAFESSFREFLTANGIRTAADIKKNPEIVAKGKQYATEQAEIATFRQYSWLANKINEIENKNAVTNIAVGAIIPFKKTPINIAKTGLNYSLLGFGKTLTYDIAQVKKGNMEASTLIDHLAQNVTGTALHLVGYMLAMSGLLSGGGEDDKEGKYDSQLGKQAYSLNIDGQSFSLSWLTPVAMPLFVGANAYEQLVEGKGWSGDVVVQTLAQTLDPLSEMSFLSSLDSVLSSYDSGIQKFAGIGETMVQNYVTQFAPTALSQVAATFDDTKRSTKVAANSGFKPFDETINKLKYKIPFLRNTLEPSIDIWGNEVKQSENWLVRGFENSIAPYSRKENIATEIDEEIKDLYGETGEDGVIPNVPNNYVNYNGEKYKMSAAEYTNYKKRYGQTANALLEELFNTNTYQNASSEERADMVNRVYDYARDEANKEYLSVQGVNYHNATEEGVEYYKPDPIKGAIENDMPVEEYSFYEENPEKYEFFKDNGISYSEYKNADEDGKRAYTWAFENPSKFTMSRAIANDVVEYRSYVSALYDLKADKDENGKSIIGSAKEKKVDYINDLDLDYGQKIILFKSLYEADDTYNYEIVDYLNGRDDISYDEMVTILKELGFTVKADGTVTWD